MGQRSEWHLTTTDQLLTPFRTASHLVLTTLGFSLLREAWFSAWSCMSSFPAGFFIFTLSCFFALHPAGYVSSHCWPIPFRAPFSHQSGLSAFTSLLRNSWTDRIWGKGPAQYSCRPASKILACTGKRKMSRPCLSSTGLFKSHRPK